MQIEVTEKESRKIYSQRYLDSRGKRKYIPLIILVIAAIAGIAVWTIHDWLGVATLAILLSPFFYISLREIKASGKYARNQIEEQK